LKKTAPNAEIIIINNGSKSDTKKYLDSLTDVNVIHWDKNKGVSKAWNTGLNLATRDVLCVLNNDVLVKNNGMQQLVSAALEHGISTAEGGCLNMDFSYSHSTFNEDESDYLCGYCMVFRRDVWKSIGEFDELFSPAYWEDTDWSIRARKLGYKWKIVQNTILHFGSQTSRQVLDLNTLLGAQRIKFVNKWNNEARGLGERILLTCDNAIQKEIQECLKEIRKHKPFARIQVLSKDKYLDADCSDEIKKFNHYTQEIDCKDYLSRPLISFVTWVNDDVKYRCFLKSSHHIKAEYIRLGQEYDSLSKAYNAGTEAATGKYFVYVHQDVEILDSLFEMKISNIFKNSMVGFAGVIGSLTNESHALWFAERRSNCRGIVAQNTNQFINLGVYNGDACLLDGLILITDKRFNFPESLPHVHFLDTWMCVQAISMGYKNWIADILVNHNSHGETGSQIYKENLMRYRLKWHYDSKVENLSFQEIKDNIPHS
jgi:GT2 family glycosyltransferase